MNYKTILDDIFGNALVTDVNENKFQFNFELKWKDHDFERSTFLSTIPISINFINWKHKSFGVSINKKNLDEIQIKMISQGLIDQNAKK